jgi:hypothetical protein
MSRIARPRQRTSPVSTTSDEKQEVSLAELSLDDNNTNTSSVTRSTRVVFDVDATAAELAAGKIVPIPNAAAVFPVEEGQTRAKGLVTGAKVHAIYQDTPTSVRFDLNIHNTADERPAVENSLGRLHTPKKTDLGMSLTSADGAFTSMLNITPFEKHRYVEGASIYSVENMADSALLKKYGSYNADNLNEGVIRFENEGYCLAEKDHVVLNVIRNNWESLGINLDDEHLFNGKFVQVPTPIFDKVAHDLKQQVLSKMPFTNLNSLAGKFSAVGNMPEHEDGPGGKYKIVVELGIQYQVM